MKNDKGITLVALVISVIVLLILAVIGIGASSGTKGNIKKSKSQIYLAELSEVEQAILELYIKYQQTGNENVLVGTRILRTEAESGLRTITEKVSGSTTTLKGKNYTSVNQEGFNASDYYYKLQEADFLKMGIKNVESIYIVNYSTGEAFNITDMVTNDGKELYIVP